ncbi:MAG: hypothetical protein QOF89_167 [Acidobacteriota bacterium]|nr:hypothetical protein [Acidobacteriota bacterium]
MSDHETPNERAGGRRGAPLSPREQARFQKATSLLRSGNGVLALVGEGGMSVEGLGVYEAFLARSWALRYDDPRGMCHLANAAVQMLDTFDPEVHGAARVADLRARAWGELANAYRVADRLREAEKAFGMAFSFLCQGTGDPSLKIRLLDLEASLLGTLREFPLAMERLKALARLYREAGDTHLAGRTLITKALYIFYRGDAEDACQTIEEGLALIDRDRDPSLTLVAAFNQLLFLVDCGRFKEAKRALFEHRSRITDQGSVANLKLRWIEGRISYGMGELASAEIAMREAKQGLTEVGMSFACALTGLDLTITLLSQGRTEEAFKEGLESAEMFLALSIHREILSTAIVLEQTLRTQTADLALLETSVRYLRKKMIELGLG